jgi:hypothetical protein
MDNIVILLNHREIKTVLYECLEVSVFFNRGDYPACRPDNIPLATQVSGPHACNFVDALDSLLLPDAMCMAARVANIIQHQSTRRSLFALRGKDAQIFIDLLHAVCSTQVFTTQPLRSYLIIAVRLLPI